MSKRFERSDVAEPHWHRSPGSTQIALNCVPRFVAWEAVQWM
jgi:hypothetical protein